MTKISSLQQEVLTNEQQYRADLRTLLSEMDLTQEESLLLEQARSGNTDARQAIVAFLLPRIERHARNYASTYSWASHRVEYLELVQEGNLAVLECLDQALATDHPYAYLTLAAYNAIRHYSKRFSSLIITPLTSGVYPLSTESLDQPLDSEGENATLLDIVGEFLVEDFSTKEVEKDPQVFEPLYQLIEENLSPNQRFVIINHYGLYENAPLTLRELNQKLGKAQAHLMREQAINKLYVCLSDAYRAYSGTLPVAPRARTKVENTALTPEQEQRLQAAYAALQQRGQRITCDALRIEAKIAVPTARKYLARLHAEKPEPTNQERLDRAYAQMEARGEKVTVEKLTAAAHVQSRVASAYLHYKRGTTPATFSTRPIEERLEEAYTALQARGEKITCKTLSREARGDATAAQRFLRKVRGSLQERLDCAYEVLREQGVNITVQRLAREAKAGYPAVRMYLHERKALQHLSHHDLLKKEMVLQEVCA